MGSRDINNRLLFSGHHKGGTTKGITPFLADLASAVAAEGYVNSIEVGTYTWGKTTTEKLLKLVPDLAHIDFCNAKKVVHHFNLTDWAMPKAPLLKSFKWRWCYDCQTSSVCNLVKYRSALERLDLACVEAMDSSGFRPSGMFDEVLCELGRSCPNLMHLSLSGDLRFTDTGVLTLLRGCPRLVSLSLKPSSIFHLVESRITLSDGALAALNDAATRNLEVNITGYIIGVPKVDVPPVAITGCKRPASASSTETP
jgi:hypothetical protein